MAITFGVLLLMVVLEVAAIIWVADHIGWWTLLALTAPTFLGLYLMQREWRKAWTSLSEALRSGQLPTGRMANASLILAGGILLTLPGLLTDIAGLILLLPFTRPFVRSAVSWWASRIIRPMPGDIGPTIIKGEAAEAETTVIRGDLDHG